MNSQKDILIETTMSALQGELKRKKLIDILSNKDKRNLLLEILNTKNKQQIPDLFLYNLDDESMAKIISLIV